MEQFNTRPTDAVASYGAEYDHYPGKEVAKHTSAACVPVEF
nr:E273 [uncultured bacterium]